MSTRKQTRVLRLGFFHFWAHRACSRASWNEKTSTAKLFGFASHVKPPPPVRRAQRGIPAPATHKPFEVNFKGLFRLRLQPLPLATTWSLELPVERGTPSFLLALEKLKPSLHFEGTAFICFPNKGERVFANYFTITAWRSSNWPAVLYIAISTTPEGCSDLRFTLLVVLNDVASSSLPTASLNTSVNSSDSLASITSI